MSRVPHAASVYASAGMLRGACVYYVGIGEECSPPHPSLSSRSRLRWRQLTPTLKPVQLLLQLPLRLYQKHPPPKRRPHPQLYHSRQVAHSLPRCLPLLALPPSHLLRLELGLSLKLRLALV